MNLSKLFEIQKQLDDRIVEKHGLQGQDLLPKKILTLQVELGELANCWRGFKFWSEDQEPRNFAKCWNCSGQGKGYFSGHKWSGDKEICIECSGTGVDKTKNPLLEEYVDCLHFILSLGLDLGVSGTIDYRSWKHADVVTQFRAIFDHITFLGEELDLNGINSRTKRLHFEMTNLLVGLAEMLSFSWDEVEQAYMQKNQVNWERQEVGY